MCSLNKVSHVGAECEKKNGQVYGTDIPTVMKEYFLFSKRTLLSAFFFYVHIIFSFYVLSPFLTTQAYTLI
jgi:hypothetical protein